MSSERRTSRRVDLSVSADLNTGDQTFTGRVKNLSAGGVGIEIDRPLAEKVNVAVSLFLVLDGIEDASAPPLELHSQVVWVAAIGPRRWEAGLRFYPLETAQARRLNGFIQQIGAGTG